MKKHMLCKIPLWLAAAAVCGTLLPISPAVAQETLLPEAADLTPKRYKVDRYASIWSERSPFEIIIEEVIEKPEEDPPFEDYSLASYTKRGNVWRVTVVNLKDPKEKHYIQSGRPSKEGFELLNFKPDRNYKNSEVTVRLNGKTGNIGFSEKRLRAGTGVKGTPGISNSVPGSKNSKQPAGRGATQRAGSPINNANNAAKPPGNTTKAAAGKTTDAAAQIRQMLQNRASNNTQGRTATQSKSTKREPRRRVILPPSR